MKRLATASILTILLAAIPFLAVKAADAPLKNSVGMTMVLIPAGTFTMGSPPGEGMRQPEERMHQVRITRPFRIDATEVTQKQWLALMNFNRSDNLGDSLPVENISWKDAVEFCRRLSEREGKTYRLPTEAEWEYACRAGSEDAFSGSDDPTRIAWYDANSSGKTHPVGSLLPNSWGLFDMHGNVAEWCADYYAPYPDQEKFDDPAGPSKGRARVIRGGSWKHFLPALRSAARSSAPASYQLGYVGFRVVMEADQ